MRRHRDLPTGTCPIPSAQERSETSNHSISHRVHYDPDIDSMGDAAVDLSTQQLQTEELLALLDRVKSLIPKFIAKTPEEEIDDNDFTRYQSRVATPVDQEPNEVENNGPQYDFSAMNEVSPWEKPQL